MCAPGSLIGIDIDYFKKVNDTHGRQAVKEQSVAFGRNQLRVTLSLGVTDYVPGEALDPFIARADAALYQAKESGRDQVIPAKQSVIYSSLLCRNMPARNRGLIMQPDRIDDAATVAETPAADQTAGTLNSTTGDIGTTVINGIRCVKSRYGVYLRSRWTDATFHFCVFGRYGHVLSDLLNNSNSDFTFIDIGANQGLYSLIAARNPACRNVYAFEPVAATYGYLLDNVMVNQARKISPINAAISDTEGRAQIAVQAGHSGAATLRGSSPLKLSSTITINTLSAAGLRSLLANADQCIIKIDVEGFEATVIKQLAEAGILARAHTVFYEVNEKWTDPADIEQRLSAVGFNSFVRSGKDTHYDVMARRS